MQRTAIMVIFTGFLFVFFKIEFLDIDLLIDAVGFLIIWNPLRILQKNNNTFANFTPLLCLLLVILSAAQLFVSIFIIDIIRYICQLLLMFLIFSGFAKKDTAAGKHMKIFVGTMIFIMEILAGSFELFMGQSYMSLVLLSANILYLLLLLRFAIVFEDAN